ncbi:MAG: nucleotidyl transferase AbiEii/AbiGii toxin family protein [Myxococcales bacterium]|nr:nucleotidyl transferase AbiEii/AbiGii toxin family protein [Myxococcales bacterium]
MTARRYSSPRAFKQAVEQRIKTAARSEADIARLRQLLVFDRFLARVAEVAGNAVTLKGGLVLELRLARARTTKDVDLLMRGPPDTVGEQLGDAGRLDLGDDMAFEVRPDPHRPDITNPGMKYQGRRFRAECQLAGKIYGRPFGVDVAFGDPIVGEPDSVVADDRLGFAGIAPPIVRLYPVASHIAEKLHAYTLPRDRPNTRVKDLPDLALLAGVGPLDRRTLRRALEQTFEYRATHDLPGSLPPPPSSWASPYDNMVVADALPWRALEDVHRAAAGFLGPALGDGADAIWDPATWSWR